MIQAGTFKIESEERDSYTGWMVTHTRSIAIEFDANNGRPYQTERYQRNGQTINSANYPADTDYAKMRRAGIVDW